MSAKRKSKRKSTGPYRSQKVANAQLRFFEVLHIIKDRNGEIIFTGSKALHDKVLKALNRFNREQKYGKAKTKAKKANRRNHGRRG